MERVNGLARRGPECLGAGRCRRPDPLTCHKASYGMAPDPVHLAADGVTWRATWEPKPEAPADKANGARKTRAARWTWEATSSVGAR